MNFMLHSSGGSGAFDAFFEIVLHGALDTLKIIPFLFLTYLFMEWLEHKGNDKIVSVLTKSGKTGPFIGGALGIVPQCGFSATAASFFSAKIITMGALVSIFLSTSDEMLPILISGSLPLPKIAIILGYKLVIGILVGLSVDAISRLFFGRRQDSQIRKLCEDEKCHCEEGILKSAIHHTVKIGLFLLTVTIIINAIVYFVGDDVLKNSVFMIPGLSHLLTALIGLIPNCAASVALTDFYLSGFISAGAMLSGLFSGAGVGLIVLFRTNKNVKQNVLLLGILVASGFIFGMIFDFLPFEM